MKYYVEGVDGATIVEIESGLAKGDMFGIVVNSEIAFYKVKKVSDTIVPKDYPVLNKGYMTLECKGEHKIVNGDTKDISNLVRGQKYHTRGKLFEVLKNKNGVMDVSPVEFKMVERVLMKDDNLIGEMEND